MTAGRSVSSETSPVNSRGPWTTIVFDTSVDSSTIAISPDSTT